MLVVSAEVWPYGDESSKFVIGSIFAGNEGSTASGDRYSVAISQLASAQIGIKGWSLDFEIGGHAREDGVWRLVQMILQHALTVSDTKSVTDDR